MSLNIMSQTLVSKNVKDIGLNSLVRTPAPYSFTLETMKFLTSMERDFNAINESFYQSILESNGDEYIINESFEDVSKKFKQLIEQFLAYIKSMFDRFIIIVNDVLKRDKSILDNRYVIANNFDETKHQFKFEGYKYTFNPNTPKYDISYYDESTRAINTLFFNIFGTAKDDAIKSMKSSMEKYKLSDEEFNEKIVKDILNGESLSSNEGYKDKLFKIFRDNATKKQELTATTAIVKDSIYKLEHFKEDIKSVKDAKKKIDSDYAKIKNDCDSSKQFIDVEKMFLNASTDRLSDSDKKEIFKLYHEATQARMTLLRKIMSYHSMAFAAKLDALRESYIQNRMVSAKALSKINGGKDTTAKAEDKVAEGVEMDSENLITLFVDCLDDFINGDYCEVPEDDISLADSTGSNDPEEIPVNPDDVNEEDLEESFKSLNAIELHNISEAVRDAISHKEYASLIDIKSSTNSNFGRDILGKIYRNRICNLSEAAMDLDKTLCIANNDIYQYLFTGKENNINFSIFDNLTKANDVYIEQVNVRKRELLKIKSISGDVDYVVEATQKYDVIEKKIINDYHKRFIKECLILASGKPSDVVLKELAILNEEADKGISKTLESIKTFFTQLWAKFVERIDYFFNGNKRYLEKNKDVILEKTPTFSVTMKDYEDGIFNLRNIFMPAFDYETLKGFLGSEEEFQAHVLKNTKPGFKEGDNFETYCINLFTGGAEEKKYTLTEADMKKIYDFCTSYNIMKKTLGKDYDAIINSISKEKNTKYSPSKSSADEPAAAPPKSQKESSLFNNATEYVYTEIYGYISEMDIVKNDDKADADKSSEDKSTDDKQQSDKSNDSSTDTKMTVTDSGKAFDIYNKVSKTFMATKLKATEIIYNDYMKIIKAHVDSFKD